MKALLRPAGEPLELYDDAVRRRKKPALATCLSSLRPIVACAYAAYDTLTPRFTSEFGSLLVDSASAEALRELYERERMNLRERAVSAQPKTEVGRATCQLCGLNSNNTLDHYLPKADFGELSVLPDNLVPCCGECNFPRAVFDSVGQRKIVHLFDDDVASIPSMLEAAVTVSDGEPCAAFSLSPASGVMADLYRRHFDTLHLKRRYEDHAPCRLDAIRTRSFMRGMFANVAAQTLKDEADVLEKRRGMNDFRVALLRGAANSASFLALFT